MIAPLISLLLTPSSAAPLSRALLRSAGPDPGHDPGVSASWPGSWPSLCFGVVLRPRSPAAVSVPEVKQRVGLSAPVLPLLAERAWSAANAGWLVEPVHDPGVRIHAGGHEPGVPAAAHAGPGVAVTHAEPGVVTDAAEEVDMRGVDLSEPDLSEADLSEPDLPEPDLSEPDQPGSVRGEAVADGVDTGEAVAEKSRCLAGSGCCCGCSSSCSCCCCCCCCCALWRGNSRRGSRRRAAAAAAPASTQSSAVAAAWPVALACFSGVDAGVEAGVTAASASARNLFEICRPSRSAEVTLAMSSTRLTPSCVRSALTWYGSSPAVVTRKCCRRLVRRAMAWFSPHALLPAARFEQ